MNVWDCRNTNKDIIKIKNIKWQGMTFQRELTIDWLWMIDAGDWVVPQTMSHHAYSEQDHISNSTVSAWYLHVLCM